MSDSFKDKSVDELQRNLSVLRNEALKLRIQKVTGQLLNTASITKNRRQVARALFELGQRR
jgi:ribosomal protein L29